MIEHWSEFFVATVGAAAALAGLIIVAMSVNISTIIKAPAMPSRAGATIGSLVLLVVTGAAGLIPAIRPEWFGAVVVIAALGQTALAVRSARMLFLHDEGAPPGANIVKAGLGLVDVVPFIAGGALLIAGLGAAGLVSIAVGFLLIFVMSAVNAWVLLVEVLR